MAQNGQSQHFISFLDRFRINKSPFLTWGCIRVSKLYIYMDVWCIYIYYGISPGYLQLNVSTETTKQYNLDALSTARRRMIPAGLRWDPARCSPNPSRCRGKFPPIAPVRSGARVREILVKARNIWWFFSWFKHQTWGKQWWIEWIG
jgi:hypothetical protein